MAIMQLAEKGLLSVDDPISKYLDESWFPPEVLEAVTVHHLLTHTSGIDRRLGVPAGSRSACHPQLRARGEISRSRQPPPAPPRTWAAVPHTACHPLV